MHTMKQLNVITQNKVHHYKKKISFWKIKKAPHNRDALSVSGLATVSRPTQGLVSVSSRTSWPVSVSSRSSGSWVLSRSRKLKVSVSVSRLKVSTNSLRNLMQNNKITNINICIVPLHNQKEF